jgi:hypothetical protein
MFKFIKNDFKMVWYALKTATKGKLPTWVIVVYYCLLAPIGFLLIPFAMLYVRIMLWRLGKISKDEEA